MQEENCQSPIPKKRELALFHGDWSSCHTLGHFRRPCAGVLFAHVRAVDEKDIRLFSAGGKRQQNRREREERHRDAAAKMPRWVLLNSFHFCVPRVIPKYESSSISDSRILPRINMIQGFNDPIGQTITPLSPYACFPVAVNTILSKRVRPF